MVAIVAHGDGGAPSQRGSSAPVLACDATVVYVGSMASSTDVPGITGDGTKCVRITAKDTALWAAFGSDPTAAADTSGSHFIDAGVTMDFGPLPRGWIVAVIDDS